MAENPPVDLRKDFTEAAKNAPLDLKPGDKGPDDKGTSKGLDSIERHKPKEAFDMKGLGGPGVRQEAAETARNKDWEKFNSDRAEKYAKMEKKALIDKNDVREPNRGKLTPEFNKASEKPIKR